MPQDLGHREEVEYIVTYLEMHERPTIQAPARPENLDLALLKSTAPPADYFLYLYGLVGAEYEWTDWLIRPRVEVEEFVGSSDVLLYSLFMDGSPGGFFMLDARETGVCDLAYFGLAPRAIGRRLGRWLLATAVDAAWMRPGTRKLTVNTNTLDHPRALGLYQRVGFEPVRRERHTRFISGKDD